MSTEQNIDPSAWREQEPGLEEVIRKYPDIPPLIILKTDIQRRGLALTRRALDAVDPERDAVHYRGLNAENRGAVPNGLVLRDGETTISNIIGDTPEPYQRRHELYTVDYIDGKFVVVDQGRVIDEVTFWPRADFSDKRTSKGTPMWQVLIARPQRLDINLYQTCDFWKEGGMCCKFCIVGPAFNKSGGDRAEFVDYDEVEEALAEAIKQPGRFRSISLCSGTIIGGEEVLDHEVKEYTAMLKRIEKYFPGRSILVQMVATAFSERQLRRLHDETILTSYTADLEVLDETVFNWVCPGKARYIGYQNWKERLYRAAEIFGPGAVTTGIVSGAELAQPGGFTNPAEAREQCLAEAEELARHGVGVSQTVFHNEPGSVFFKQPLVPLDYLVSVTRGLDELSRKYGLDFHCDDYRTCGNHPNTDLARAWHGK